MPAFDTDLHYLNIEEVSNLSIGQNGAVVRTTTTATSGEFYAIQVIADAVFTSLTGNYTGDTLAGMTLTAGTVLYGRFTAFTLTSGKVIAYKTID